MKNSDYYQSLRRDVISMILLGCKDVIRYEPDQLIEVKPGRKSPIHVNFKHTLNDIILREKIAVCLANNLRTNKVSYICGVESGGSYFASRCADILGTPISLFRKEDKTYAEQGRIVGPNPEEDSIIAVVDDTLVTGKTIEPAVEYLSAFSGNIQAHCILTYGLDAEVRRRVKLSSINPVFEIQELIQLGTEQGIFDAQASQFVKSFVEERQVGVPE